MVCPLNSRGIFRDAFKILSKDIVKAKDAEGMMALIEERTDLQYDDFKVEGADDGKPDDVHR